MEIDKYNFRQVILDFVKQLDKELPFYNELNLSRRPFDKIVICGMGGSALSGDFFSYFKSEKFSPLIPNVPVSLHRSYDLPPDVTQNTLIICNSYSGNTEEPISSFFKAQEQSLEIAGITCNGQMKELFQKYKTPWVKIPKNNIPPRLSLGYQLNGLIKIFMAYGLLTSSAQNEISNLSRKIEPQQLENDAKAKYGKLANKIPVIYSSDNNGLISRIWKIQFNENAKIPAFFNVFPELNHNEMAGWTKNLGAFSFLFLYDNDDLPQIRKRMELTGEFLKKAGHEVTDIDLNKGNALEQLFWGLSYGNWLSYYLALYYGLDPTPIEIVEEFKKRL